ncbi:MAG TPA: sigma-54 dependent transcriptional regulator [Vicinamibacterales bacterium]
MSGKRSRRVLVVDDEIETADWLALTLTSAGYEVRVANRGDEAVERFAEWLPDAAVVDLVLPDLDGVELVRRFKARAPQTEVLVLSAQGSIPRAVAAMKAGAAYFLEKPIEGETLLAILSRCIERLDLEAENLALRRALRDRGFDEIIGRSEPMRELFEMIGAVADSDANILIQGENGTGKELIANAIHAHSRRARKPFVKINCAAIPKELIEAELFGYRRGAFTGAVHDREGLLEYAQGGSLLLDEIGEMPPYLQSKLLRVLQERTYRPVGGDRVVHVDFRLICATNIDLDAALKSGQLREDLYFRINTITLRVPPLRERTEDIPLLCDHFLERFRQRYRRNVRSISPAAYHLLIRNRWPGNVRELENAIERAVLLAKGPEITPADLPESLREAPTGAPEVVLPPHHSLAEIERLAILQALERTSWNKQEAAAQLGLYRPTLYSKMRKHKIADEGRARRAARAASPARAERTRDGERKGA